jgi:hypothetical protein
MKPNSPFDPEHDRELGDALREALTPETDREFVGRVLARLPAVRSSWEVLAGWARPGIAAALLFAAALGYWLMPRDSGGSAPTGADVLAVDQTLEQDALASVVLGSGR